MNLTKKITQIFSLIFLSLFLASCEVDGCVEADEYDTESSVVEANPVKDGVSGTYEHNVGGQKAEWHDTGLKSNNEAFIILISGAWSPWNGVGMSDKTLSATPRCNFCAKKNGVPNCICYSGQIPEAETCPDGNKCATFTKPSGEVVPLNCSSHEHQNNPASCTCTNNPEYGSALDASGVNHIPLNVLTKNGDVKIADQQSSCKYDRGMGAYIGLFGNNGSDVPLRVYHLLSFNKVCNVVTNSNGECLDANGKDISRYSFSSANGRNFVKDDSVSPIQYHGPNEVVKLIILDSYYSDNYGRYNLVFMRGVGTTRDSGLLESMVTMVEESLLGKINTTSGERDGGIIKFMYKSIVQDSVFIKVLQISLSLYIAVFGAATLFGVAEITRKEIYSRIVKIGLIVFFTSAGSWKMYNNIVVNFFIDGMNYAVAGIMDLSDSSTIDLKDNGETSVLKISQMNRESDLSSATRFSYVDLTIKKLLSENTAKKVFGLFFGNYYGIILIPMIYMLIGFYVYVMVLVATMYLVNLIKIIFALSLGPVFICFSMFKNTQQMFKNWVSFLGARSLEILFLFLILYNFLIIIDQHFTTLLAFRVCPQVYNLKLFSIKILKAESGRNFVDWIAESAIIAGLLFIMKLVVDKAQSVSGALITIDGVDNKDNKGGESNMASGALGQVMALGKSIASGGLGYAERGGAIALKGAAMAARKTAGAMGIASAWNRAGEAVGFRGLRTRARDSIIDAQIDKFAKEAKAQGLSPEKSDQYVRQKTVAAIQNQGKLIGKANPTVSDHSPGKLALAGVDIASTLKRLDQKLIRDPMREMIKEEAKKLRSSGKIPLTKSEMRDKIRENVQKEMEKRLTASGIDPSKAAFHLRKMDSSNLSSYLHYGKGFGKGDIERAAYEGSYESMGTSQAAKLFAKNPEEKNKYLDYLQAQEIKRHQATEDSKSSSWKIVRGVSRLGNAISKGYDNIRRDVENNPKMARENFLRKSEIQNNYRSRGGKLNPFSAINAVDKHFNFSGVGDGKFSEIKQRAKDESRKSALKHLASATKPDLSGASEKQKEKIMAREDRKAAFLQGQIKAEAIKDLKKSLDTIDKAEKFTFGSRNARMTPEEIKSDRQRIVAKTAAELADAMKNGVKEGDLSLFERAARLDYVCERLGANLDSLKRDLREEGLKAAVYDTTAVKESFVAIVAEVAQKDIADRVSKIEERLDEKLKDPATTPEQAAQAREDAKKEMVDQNLVPQQSGALFATDFKVEFGASATSVLLTEGPDIGLKAGSILLGGPSDKKSGNSKVKDALSAGKQQAESLAKITRLSKKLKEHELAELKKKGAPEDVAKIAMLESEVSHLEKDLKRFESEVERSEREILAQE